MKLKWAWRRSPSGEPPVVVYLGVHDLDYPRNSLIRGGLERVGFDVRVLKRSERNGAIVRAVKVVRQFLALRRLPVLIVTSEFSSDLAPVGRLLSWVSKCPHVVDFFVGMVETFVEDRRVATSKSFRGRLFALQDWIAVRSADLLLCDTAVRGSRFRSLFGGSASWVSIPAGLPSWVDPAALVELQSRRLGLPRVLYYGNYVPLHGLWTVVEASRQVADRMSFELVLIGTGLERGRVVSALENVAGLTLTVSDWASGEELRSAIMSSDVVLGVFGDSDKASSVIPNKVWQGIGMGSVVVSRSSDAYLEIPSECLSDVVVVPPADSLALSTALLESLGQQEKPVSERIESNMLVRNFVDFRLECGLVEIVRLAGVDR